jgi:uncharacterized membrane protein
MDELLNLLFRWGHILFGVTWIGLLYYFNFIQTEYVKEAEEAGKKDVVSKLAPRALWWFRWAALFTFLTGVVLLYIIQAVVSMDIILGATMGTFMMLNVWGIIWPNQKIVIGLKDGDPGVAGPKASLASRTNTLFSVPMLYCMVSSTHPTMFTTAGGYINVTPTGEVVSTLNEIALLVGLALILLIQANVIWGKMLGVISSVRSVIISSFVLTIIISGLGSYL